MSPEEYYQLITLLQKEVIKERLSYPDEIVRHPDRDGWTFFAPSRYFRPAEPLMSEEIVNDLRDNGKMLLDVGCGPAHLEQLIVARLGIKPEQITLADISEKYVPQGFEFFQFDMFKDWPDFGKSFDYIIFPAAPLLGLNGLEQFQKDLYHTITMALRALNAGGQVRLMCGVLPWYRDPVKIQVESAFPEAVMHNNFTLTYALKTHHQE
ncbi:MAG: class I SAM-dependent methyltransferase [Nanoarchaeota archaeon]